MEIYYDICGASRLALCERTGEKFCAVAEEKFANADFPSLDAAVEQFLVGKPNDIARACFGIPGPVTGEVVKFANLRWAIDARAIKNALGIEQVGLINDLEANAYGLSELGATDFVVLNDGVKNQSGNAAIISAGTGLGEAGLHFEKEM